MQRVMIIGQPGSGKSTLARKLGDATGLPVFHIDHIHWMPGWKERPRDAKTALCHEVHVQDRWIFEGGHTRTWPERLERCDTFIWLDVPVSTRLRRVIWRSVRYRGQTRPDMPTGCPERLDWEFLKWIWETRNTVRAGAERWFQMALSNKDCFRMQTFSEVERFLETARNSTLS